MLPCVSNTFEGRDVFAPVSAYLAKGVEVEKFDPELPDFVRLLFVEPKIFEGRIIGEVLHIDGFGNIVTNIRRRLLNDLKIAEEFSVKVTINKCSKRRISCRKYAEVPANAPLLIVGSNDFLEISVNQGSVNEKFDDKVDDRVEVSIQDLRFV